MKALVGDGCSARAGTGNLGYQSKDYYQKSTRKHAGRGLTGSYKTAFNEAEKTKQTRAGCFTKQTDDESVYRGKITESIFNPETAIAICKMYGKQDGVCFDPFAGGGTRAIIASKCGMSYIGCEIRGEEVKAIYERCHENNVLNIKILNCSSTSVPDMNDNSSDFLITCPPYYDLEKYDGGEQDLSMAPTYQGFLDGIRLVARESHRILKPDSYSCWVVGLHRNSGMELLPLHHDIAKIHQEEGFFFKEEVILHMENTGAIRRVGGFEKGGKHLVRTHEYLLVFRNK